MIVTFSPLTSATLSSILGRVEVAYTNPCEVIVSSQVGAVIIPVNFALVSVISEASSVFKVGVVVHYSFTSSLEQVKKRSVIRNKLKYFFIFGSHLK